MSAPLSVGDYVTLHVDGRNTGITGRIVGTIDTPNFGVLPCVSYFDDEDDLGEPESWDSLVLLDRSSVSRGTVDG